MKSIVYLAFIVILFSCNTGFWNNKPIVQKNDLFKNVPDTEKDKIEIFPLKIGNYWIYKTLDKSTTKRYVITDTVRIDGELWYESEYDNSFEGYVCCRNDGIWVRKIKSSKPYLFLKYPSKVGDSYEMPDGRKKLKVQVINTKEKIYTYFGVQYAYIYRFDLENVINFMFYIPGIGYYGTNYNRDRTYIPELIEFNVK